MNGTAFNIKQMKWRQT